MKLWETTARSDDEYDPFNENDKRPSMIISIWVLCDRSYSFKIDTDLFTWIIRADTIKLVELATLTFRSTVSPIELVNVW